MIEGRDIGTVVAPGRRGEGLPRRRRGRARAPPAGRAARASAPTRSPPTCSCATRATRRRCSRPRTRDGSTRPSSTSTTSSTGSRSSSARRSRRAVNTRRRSLWAVGRADHRRRRRASRRACASTARSASRRGRRRPRAQPLLAGSTRPPSAPRRPRTIYYMAKIEAHRVPGLGQLIRAFGTFSVRRGESDREAVRLMREIVARRPRARPLRRGDAPARGVPGEVKPGAAMVALQEDVPVVSAAIHGTHDWQLGNFRPSRSPGASRCASTACRAARRATARRRPRSSARSGGCGNSSSTVHDAGPAARRHAARMTEAPRRRAGGARSARSRSSASRTSASRRSSTA